MKNVPQLYRTCNAKWSKITANYIRFCKSEENANCQKVLEIAKSRRFLAKLPRNVGAPAGIRFSAEKPRAGKHATGIFAWTALSNPLRFKNRASQKGCSVFGAPAGIRTPDTLLKRHLRKNPQSIDIPSFFELLEAKNTALVPQKLR